MKPILTVLKNLVVEIVCMAIIISFMLVFLLIWLSPGNCVVIGEPNPIIRIIESILLLVALTIIINQTIKKARKYINLMKDTH